MTCMFCLFIYMTFTVVPETSHTGQIIMPLLPVCQLTELKNCSGGRANAYYHHPKVNSLQPYHTA